MAESQDADCCCRLQHSLLLVQVVQGIIVSIVGEGDGVEIEVHGQP